MYQIDNKELYDFKKVKVKVQVNEKNFHRQGINSLNSAITPEYISKNNLWFLEFYYEFPEDTYRKENMNCYLYVSSDKIYDYYPEFRFKMGNRVRVVIALKNANDFPEEIDIELVKIKYDGAADN